jgi:hypothetical protein
MLPTKAYGTKEGLEYINLSRYVLFSRQWCFDGEKINSNSFHLYPLSMRGEEVLHTMVRTFKIFLFLLILTRIRILKKINVL